MLAVVLALLFGYVFGSIPSGVIVTRLAGAADPRGIGSKNIGATNVLRTGRKDLAAVTLLADALKGTVPVLIARHLDGGHSTVDLDVAAAAGAFLGHLFPIFLGFRGGKGVATFIGCLIALSWPAAIVFAVLWLAVAFLTRYSSAGALTASLASPAALALFGRKEAAVLFVFLAALIWLRHRTNIMRLMAGTESKIGQKTSGQTS